jgi:hypothetical protein
LMVVQTAHRTLSPSPTLPVYQFWNSHIQKAALLSNDVNHWGDFIKASKDWILGHGVL